MRDEYQPRTPERIVEILRSEGRNPRAWQSEAADTIERLQAAVSRIDAINDSPVRFSEEINEVCGRILRPHLYQQNGSKNGGA